MPHPMQMFYGNLPESGNNKCKLNKDMLLSWLFSEGNDITKTYTNRDYWLDIKIVKGEILWRLAKECGVLGSKCHVMDFNHLI